MNGVFLTILKDIGKELLQTTAETLIEAAIEEVETQQSYEESKKMPRPADTVSFIADGKWPYYYNTRLRKTNKAKIKLHPLTQLLYSCPNIGISAPTLEGAARLFNKRTSGRLPFAGNTSLKYKNLAFARV